ncbi:Ig-like domain-containing protein [uncultured Aquimarina sp.]|uniref:Ig-like domain-containing protein n=1 Tax=uncultured Aquimarina sp. TaxID=575652 RepID=UPI002607201C|nr:Ig-like domain-containing protein [uncultured Aquimarina sp.]
MKKNVITTMLLCLLILQLYGQQPAITTNANDVFTLVDDMSDEFETGGINWSGKWEQNNNLPNIAAWNLTNSSNVSQGDYFDRGSAKITARYNGVNPDGTSIAVNGKFYNAGCLQSKQSLPPNFEGYIEAVIRGADIDNPDPHPFNGGIDKSRGLCPAFWLYSKFFDNNPADGGVVYTEIDIQELQQHDFYDGVQDGVEDTESNLHIAFKNGNGRRWVRPKQNPDEQLNKYPLGFDPREDWHTYGCEITRDEIHFFVDGKKVGKTLKNTHWGKLPLRVILSLGMRVPFVDFGGNAFTSFDPQGEYPNNQRLKTLAERARKQLGELPESMYVDYVRVWNKTSSNTNTPPELAITSPSSNQQFEQGEEIIITTEASDADGSIAKVEFYDGNQLLGSKTAIPYEFTYTGAPQGNRNIRVIAYDDQGEKAEESVIITINSTDNNPPTNGQPVITTNPDDVFTLIEDMSDEFNSGGINWSGKWEQNNNLPNIAAWNLTNSSNVSRGDYFNRGSAKITARYNGVNPNGTSIAVNGKFYNAGCLQSKQSLPPNFEGYIEAVIRGADIDNVDPHPFNGGIDKSRGLCPAFWLYSKFFDNNPAEDGVIYTEIDIQELQQHDFYNGVQDGVEDTESNLHIAFKNGNGRRWVRPKQNPDEQLNKYPLGFDPRKGWHTYGCEITRDEIHFFVDGKKVGKTLKNTHWGKLPLRVIMSLGMRVPFVDFGGNAFTSFDPQGDYPNNQRLQTLAERARQQLGELPESMYVDYIRVWNKTNADNNTPPELTITSPNANQQFDFGDEIIIRAEASDADGSISKVEFYDGNQLLDTKTSAPYQFTYTNAAEGNRNIRVIAYDDEAEKTEASVSVIVNPTDDVPNPTGEFFIVHRATGKKLRAVNNQNGSEIKLSPARNISNWVKWKKVNGDNGWFYFQNVKTKKYFRPKGANGEDGNILEQQPNTFTGAWTQWKEIPSNNSFVFLRNRASGKYLRPKTNKNNSVIELRPNTEINNRTQWKLVPVKSTTSRINESNIEIYPNPAEDIVTIELDDFDETNTKVTVISMIGSVVLTPQSITENEVVLDVSRLKEGIYFLKIQNGTRTISKRLLIK